MKKSFKYIAAGLVAVSVASCADLDTEYLGNYVSDSQKEDAISGKPELLSAGVTAIFSNANRYGAVFDKHFDFGYATLMLGFDLQTADCIGADSGYNWFTYWEGFTSPTNTGTPAAEAWYSTYSTIKVCNNVLSTIDPETEDKEILFYYGNALGTRAFYYWVLAQAFQFNYQINPDAPCVPILTEKNADEAAINGCPRATVAEVYAQIMDDLDAAISAFERSGLQPSQMMSSKPKRMVSLATAYGLRARANLSMGKYAEAASDAANAIAKFSGSPYSREQVSVPTFTSLDDSAWMWGIAVAETDRVVTTGICNWPSHMVTFCSGYVNVGAWKWCAQDLYNSIPRTDVRKGWFLDENFTSPNLNEEQQAFINDYIGGWSLNYSEANYIFPYTNVKFNSYQGKILQNINSNDIPLMRVEEMYYILAEAQAMAGAPVDGKSTLENFVRTYRDPSYTCSASSAEEIQEEVFHQKRIELWGEGLIYFDYMRLNKGIDRRRAMYPYSLTYNIPAGSPELIYLIPTGEISANKQISDADNNQSGSRPTPVTPL